jgi:hypothetical protein
MGDILNHGFRAVTSDRDVICADPSTVSHDGKVDRGGIRIRPHRRHKRGSTQRRAQETTTHQPSKRRTGEPANHNPFRRPRHSHFLNAMIGRE